MICFWVLWLIKIDRLTKRKNTTTLPTFWWNGADDSVLNWRVSLPKPVGIFCANDNHAFYLANLCRLYGIGIPEEAAILGVDNDESLCKTTCRRYRVLIRMPN
jgi:DNA-binding LacI/PurR family transcriptional regulator